MPLQGRLEVRHKQTAVHWSLRKSVAVLTKNHCPKSRRQKKGITSVGVQRKKTAKKILRNTTTRSAAHEFSPF